MRVILSAERNALSEYKRVNLNKNIGWRQYKRRSVIILILYTE